MKLPTGETLPEYDDPNNDGVDVGKLADWLREHRGWGDATLAWLPETFIRDVVTALQAVGDATLLKNGTYRALRADGAAVERLNAWLANHGMAECIVKHDGDAVAAAVDLLGTARPTATED